MSYSISQANSDVKEIRLATEVFGKQLESSCNRQDQIISEMNNNVKDIKEKLKNIEERERSVEERLQKIESFIADDSDIRKSNYGSLQKSSRNMQLFLIIILILLVFSIAYPFAKEFLKF